MCVKKTQKRERVKKEENRKKVSEKKSSKQDEREKKKINLIKYFVECMFGGIYSQGYDVDCVRCCFKIE